MWLHKSINTQKRAELFEYIDIHNKIPTDEMYTFKDILKFVKKCIVEGDSPAQIKRKLGVDSKKYIRYFSRIERKNLNEEFVKYKEVKKIQHKDDVKLTKQQRRKTKIQQYLKDGLKSGRIMGRMNVKKWSDDDQKWFKTTFDNLNIEFLLDM